MTLSEFQKHCLSTAKWDRHTHEGLLYTTLGLAGEAGEVANKVKKLIRDHNSIEEVELEVLDGIAMEVGDVLYYCVAVLDELDHDAVDIATALLLKLASRYERGVISGSGDNR